jgi:hypothetical protein
VFAESQSWQAHRARAPSRSSGSSGAVGTVLSRILVVPVCYGPSRAAGSSNYIEIGQSSNWLRTDRGASLNVGASTQETSRCHGSGAAVGRGTCDSSCPAGSNWNFYSWRGGGDGGCQLLWPRMRGLSRRIRSTRQLIRCGLPALSSPAPEPSPNRFEKRVGLRHAAVVRNRQCRRLGGGFARQWFGSL